MWGVCCCFLGDSRVRVRQEVALGAAREVLATPVRKMPYSAPAQQLGSATEAVGYAHSTANGRALYCTVGLKAPLGVG